MTTRSSESADGRVRVEYVGLRELVSWPRNPKKHSETDIQASISRFGYVQPIVVDERTGRIVAGHGRLDALMQMRERGETPPARVVVESGEWKVPVLRGVGFATEQEAEAFLLADNQTTVLGGWDDAALGEMLRDLQTAQVPIIGWTDREVDKLIEVAAHMRSASGEGDGATDPQLDGRGLIYSVIVDLENEQAQGALLAELEKRGFNCRLLIA